LIPVAELERWLDRNAARTQAEWRLAAGRMIQWRVLGESRRSASSGLSGP
jgi:hypothetical protein